MSRIGEKGEDAGRNSRLLVCVNGGGGQRCHLLKWRGPDSEEGLYIWTCEA